MKKFGLIAFALVSFIFLAGYGFSATSAAARTSGKAAANSATPLTKQNKTKLQNAAMVNGTPIPMSDYQARIDQILNQFSVAGRQLNEKEMSAVKTKVLDNLISRELLKQEAKKRGIKANDTEVNAELDALKKGTTPENFASSLKQMNMTESTLKDYLASQLAIRKLIDRDLASDTKVTPKEVKDFYDGNPDLFKTPEMVRASHILVKVDKTASAKQKAEALAKIKAIQKRLLKGEDFAKVAKEVSDDPGSKANGGDLNFFRKGQMVPEFEKVAFSLKPGQMSGIVKTRFGYHIIKVTDRKPAGVVPFNQIKSRIEQHLKAEKMAQVLPKYIEKLKSGAKIKIFVKA